MGYPPAGGYPAAPVAYPPGVGGYPPQPGYPQPGYGAPPAQPYSGLFNLDSPNLLIT